MSFLSSIASFLYFAQNNRPCLNNEAWAISIKIFNWLAGDDVAAGIHDLVRVALHVLHIVIRFITASEAQQFAVAVVDVPDDVVTGLFGEDRAAVGEVVGGGSNQSLPTATTAAVGGFGLVFGFEEAMQRF